MLKGYEYQSDFARRYYAQGREEGLLEGRSEAVLRVLAVRRIPLSSDQEAKIRAAVKTETFDGWLERAMRVASADELFD